jgi:DNA-binding NtrC family response regulator
MVVEGSFREDLYFRVNTFEIQLPPLRERKEDIPELARTLIMRYMKRRDVSDNALSAETVQILKLHDWSGNVRELANALEHAVIMSDGEVIEPEDLPAGILRHAAASGLIKTATVELSKCPKTLREIEMDVIYRVLDKHQGDKPKAANELGIALKTLYNKLNGDTTKAAG